MHQSVCRMGDGLYPVIILGRMITDYGVLEEYGVNRP